jgi:hypothetical protein
MSKNAIIRSSKALPTIDRVCSKALFFINVSSMYGRLQGFSNGNSDKNASAKRA